MVPLFSLRVVIVPTLDTVTALFRDPEEEVPSLRMDPDSLGVVLRVEARLDVLPVEAEAKEAEDGVEVTFEWDTGSLLLCLRQVLIVP